MNADVAIFFSRNRSARTARMTREIAAGAIKTGRPAQQRD